MLGGPAGNRKERNDAAVSGPNFTSETLRGQSVAAQREANFRRVNTDKGTKRRSSLMAVFPPSIVGKLGSLYLSRPLHVMLGRARAQSVVFEPKNIQRLGHPLRRAAPAPAGWAPPRGSAASPARPPQPGVAPCLDLSSATRLT